MRRDLTSLAFILILTGLALSVIFAPNNTWLNGRDVSTRLGLDLQGGTQVLLAAAPGQTVNAETMTTALGVVERRVNGLGVAESVVQRAGQDRLIVELPGVKDPEKAVETLRGTGKLEFVDTEGQSLPTGLVVRSTGNPSPIAFQTTPGVTTTANLDTSGKVYKSITDGKDLNLSSVTPNFGSSNGVSSQYAVNFAFTGTSAAQLASFSAASVGKPMCIVLDSTVFSCPTIQAALVGGSGQITTATRADAERIYNQLKYGALPISFTVESSRTVTASLGQDAVRSSVVAGVVGFVIVALFMIIYYRLPGVLAVVALAIYTVLIYAIYRLIPITLTLPGIAGFILSIGLAVDANVLIFARLKDEVRRGRSMRQAVEAGFDEAWPAIRDSSAATFITSIILFAFGNSFGVSLIKGFALTLGLGILLNLFTAVVVTRTLLRLVVALRSSQSHWLYAVDDVAEARETGRVTV